MYRGVMLRPRLWRHPLDQVGSFFSWLFGTRMGVLALVLGGLVICTIIALVSERRTRLMFPEREKSENDWNLFGDDEEGWSDFEDDNK